MLQILAYIVQGIKDNFQELNHPDSRNQGWHEHKLQHKYIWDNSLNPREVDMTTQSDKDYVKGYILPRKKQNIATQKSSSWKKESGMSVRSLGTTDAYGFLKTKSLPCNEPDISQTNRICNI